jgi:hypothetical protein
LVVPDGVGTHRAALRRCQRTHPVTAIRAVELLQRATASLGSRWRLRFGLEFERQRVHILSSSVHPRGDWAYEPHVAQGTRYVALFRACAAKACDQLCERRHLSPSTNGRKAALAGRLLALLSRTLFASLRMPRVPEGASAIYGAKPEFWPQGQCDPHYTYEPDRVSRGPPSCETWSRHAPLRAFWSRFRLKARPYDFPERDALQERDYAAGDRRIVN